MAKPWNVDELAAISGETESRLTWYADSGLLLRDQPGDVQTQATWQDAEYAFCSDMCHQAFTESPARYASTAGAEAGLT